MAMGVDVMQGQRPAAAGEEGPHSAKAAFNRLRASGQLGAGEPEAKGLKGDLTPAQLAVVNNATLYERYEQAYWRLFWMWKNSATGASMGMERALRYWHFRFGMARASLDVSRE